VAKFSETDKYALLAHKTVYQIAWQKVKIEENGRITPLSSYDFTIFDSDYSQVEASFQLSMKDVDLVTFWGMSADITHLKSNGVKLDYKRIDELKMCAMLELKPVFNMKGQERPKEEELMLFCQIHERQLHTADEDVRHLVMCLEYLLNH